jgi:GNAT superfamily N-acetyltransferase
MWGMERFVSNSTNTAVRQAVHSDLGTVWSFLQKKAAFDNCLDRLEVTPETLEDALFGISPLMGTLLAEVESEPVGFATYYFTFSTYMARRCLWLDDLYVDEHYRGRGIGTKLLRALASVAAEHDCGRLEWITGAANAKAIEFYERMGAEVKHTARLCRLNEHGIEALTGSRA